MSSWSVFSISFISCFCLASVYVYIFRNHLLVKKNLQHVYRSVCNCMCRIWTHRIGWNSLPDNLRDSNVSRDSFRKLLKSYLFTHYWNIERIRGFTRMRYTNLLRSTYLLTLTLVWFDALTRVDALGVNGDFECFHIGVECVYFRCLSHYLWFP